MKVMLAMSGGVDSSVAGARLLAAGHTVVGVTMRLWGGESDTGCCSVADVDDARRVAQQLAIDHVVFNFADDFHEHVVNPYVSAHLTGRTPNPCIECNRHVKFARLAERADVLGFDAVATGHHARIGRGANGRYTLERAVDRAKDQSYVVHMLDQSDLASTLFPVGEITKAEVRGIATRLGLRTAAKPDSQDVCFVTSTGGRQQFLGRRIPFRRADVVDTDGRPVGTIDALELVTIGQRRRLGLPGGGPKRYVVGVDHTDAIVTIGSAHHLVDTGLRVTDVSWVDEPRAGDVLVQCSAHGAPRPATIAPSAGGIEVTWRTPQRRVAPGQSVVFYDPTDRIVYGGGLAAN